MKKHYHMICEYYQFNLSVIYYIIHIIYYAELSFPTCFNCLSRTVALQRE